MVVIKMERLMADEITVDEHFSQQQETMNLFTLEQVPDKPQMVKVTPWVGSAGCQCSASLVIARDSIYD
jgi:hypothetical protein